ncbi:hypothetical protein GI374_07555 [Paracoccus sp. S-4012]|nr:hypothetical protein [Paracoccus sp. S-4012]
MGTVGGGERGYVDWGAILAGAAIAAGVSVVLTGFAAGLGLGAISADPDENMISGWGVALTGLFTVIGMVAAYMLGGYIAGRMRRPAGSADRDELTARDGIHGLVVWALGMILGGILAMGAVTGTARAVGDAAGTAVEAAGAAVGGIAQGAGQLAGGIASGVGQAAAPAIEQAQASPGNPLDYITDRMLRQTPPPAAATPQGAADPATMRAEVSAILGNALVTGEMSEADQAYLRDVIAARTGLPPAQVEARAAEAVQSAQQLRAEGEQRLAEAQQAAQEVADQAIEAAEAARHAAILSAFLLAAAALVAAVAAYIGAVKGGRHRDEGRLWGGLRYHR